MSIEGDTGDRVPQMYSALLTPGPAFVARGELYRYFEKALLKKALRQRLPRACVSGLFSELGDSL